MDALQRSGVEGAKISLHGAAIDAADATPRETERAGVRHVALRVLIGAAAGTIVGALLGALAGLILYGSPQTGEPSGFTGLAIGGALALGAVGGIAAGVGSLDLSSRWDSTFGSSPGEVVVAVHSDDPKELERARRTLASHDAIDVRDGTIEEPRHQAG